MDLNSCIGIIGGDLRIIRLTQMLAQENYYIYTYGLDKYNFENKKIIRCKTTEEVIKNCNYIISGIPFSKDGMYLNAPFSSIQIKIDDLLKILTSQTLIAGSIKADIKQKAKIKLIDLMEKENLTVLNIIPTVEGALQFAMEQTEFTIHSSNCLILGFGRIGKLLAKALKSLGANVSCEARKESDLAWIKAYNYKGIHLNNLEENLLENDYDIIFNTIPMMILDEAKLKLIKNKKTLIIELASAPGGIDFKKAEAYNVKVIKALGLPGKVAPLTAAKYIRETLKEII